MHCRDPQHVPRFNGVAVYTLYYGYKTMFVYLKENEAHNVTKEARVQDVICRNSFREVAGRAMYEAFRKEGSSFWVRLSRGDPPPAHAAGWFQMTPWAALPLRGQGACVLILRGKIWVSGVKILFLHSLISFPPFSNYFPRLGTSIAHHHSSTPVPMSMWGCSSITGNSPMQRFGRDTSRILFSGK